MTSSINVEFTIEPTVKPTIKLTIEPTVKTIVDIHKCTIQADCNQVDDNANGCTIRADYNCRHHAHLVIAVIHTIAINFFVIHTIAIIFFAIHAIAHAYSNFELRF
jgi:hypothetical protein